MLYLFHGKENPSMPGHVAVVIVSKIKPLLASISIQFRCVRGGVAWQGGVRHNILFCVRVAKCRAYIREAIHFAYNESISRTFSGICPSIYFCFEMARA